MFTSRRERRLWIWTAIVVVSVYATLGIAPRAPGGADTVVAIAFVSALVFLAGTGIAFAVRGRADRLDLGLLFGVVGTYCLVFVRVAETTERSHLIEYGLIGLLVYEALRERWLERTSPGPTALAAFVIAGGFGVIDEVVQLAIPTRVFDLLDVWVNLTAAGLSIMARVLLGRVARRRNRPAA